AAAAAAVSSLDPSSTTMISRHGAAVRRSPTTAATDAASLYAGMTMLVASAPAISHQPSTVRHEPIDDPVPGDRPRALVAGVAESLGGASIACQPRDGRTNGLGRWRGDESGHTIGDELEWAAGIHSRHDRFV